MWIMGNIILDIRTLYNATLYGLKIKTQNEKINDLIEVDTILIIITISLVVHILPSIPIVVLCAKYARWIDKRQASERRIDESKKNIQTQVEGSTTPLHKETEEGWPEAIRKPTSVYPATMGELYNRYPKVMKKRNPIEVLDLRWFKESLNIWHALTLCEADAIFMGNSEQLHSPKTGKIWQHQYWKLVLSYNGQHGKDRKQVP